MKIDAHQHFWKYSHKDYGWIGDTMKVLKRNFLPEDLKAICLQNGIDGTIAVQARQTLEETRWLLKLTENNQIIKGVVGWVDLCSEQVEEQLSEFSQHDHFVGVRHVVQDEPDERFMLKESFPKGIEKLKKYNLTYDILIFPKQLPAAIELVRMFPDQPFVLDHIAKPQIKDRVFSPWDENIKKLALFSNVYCKVSGMVTEADWKAWEKEDFIPYLDIVIEAFGANRIMFGSDWPVCTLAASYDEVGEIFSCYLDKKDFGRKDIQGMMGMNALKFYKIDVVED